MLRSAFTTPASNMGPVLSRSGRIFPFFRPRTLREIYAQPVVEVGRLQVADLFSSWASHTREPSGNILKRYDLRNEGIEKDGEIVWEEPITRFSCLHEALLTAIEADQAVSAAGLKSWNLLGRRQVLKPDKIYDKPGNVHADGLGHKPHQRIYLCASEDPTCVVSHEDTLTILEKKKPELLDMPFDNNFAGALQDVCLQLEQDFYKVARQINPNSVYRLTGATLHFPPKVKQGRVFFQAVCQDGPSHY